MHMKSCGYFLVYCLFMCVKAFIACSHVQDFKTLSKREKLQKTETIIYMNERDQFFSLFV